MFVSASEPVLIRVRVVSLEIHVLLVMIPVEESRSPLEDSRLVRLVWQ